MAPILLHYYVTYRCNARCAFCTIWDPARPGHDAAPTWEAMRANLAAARRLGARFVDFGGGEPLLYRDLPRALRQAKLLGYRTSVTTNCLVYPRRAREIAGHVDLLHFSLDAADRQMHDRIRGVPCYDRVMESLDLACALGERPDLLFTATAETYRQIEPLARLARQRRVMLIVNPEFAGVGGEVLPTDALDHLERFAGEPHVYVNRAFHRLIRRGGNDTARPVCRAAHAAIVISPDDRLLLPCFHRAQESAPIAGKLEDIWGSTLAERYRRMDGRHPFCVGCTINCYMDPSFLYRADAYLWLSLRAKVKYALDKYFRAGRAMP